MKALGVPCVPGSDGGVPDYENAVKVAEKIGYPIIIKATAGGGGRGMKVANNVAELEIAFRSARAEAKSAFGNDEVYMEKYLTTPPETIVKHVIESIRLKKSKIVFGNDSFKTWLGSNFVPQGILKGIIWNEIKNVVNKDEYRKFIK